MHPGQSARADHPTSRRISTRRRPQIGMHYTCHPHLAGRSSEYFISTAVVRRALFDIAYLEVL